MPHAATRTTASLSSAPTSLPLGQAIDDEFAPRKPLLPIRVRGRQGGDDLTAVPWCRKEAAHVLLHDLPPGRYLPRPLKEIEAESVAYVVSSVHGMDTDGYSFPYVAAWAGDSGRRAVSETQGRVAQAAWAIITLSPAEHALGGRPPGVDPAVEMARQSEQAGLGARATGATRAAAPIGPVVA
jgi:hypothetical protein